MKENAKTFTSAMVTVTKNERVYEGFFTIGRYQLSHPLFNGGQSDTLTREAFERTPAVVLLPYDPIRDEVVMIEQFRVGAFVGGADHPWLLELVAGIIDTDESPEAVAHREAKEEAGIAVSNLKLITEYWTSPGGSTERVYLYYGEVDASKAKGIHGLLSEGEDIRVTVLKSQEAFEAIKTGRINNAATIIAIQWLALNRGNLKC